MKKKFNNSAGITLIEMLIGVVITALMMGAMFTTYNVVNNSYSQVSDRAKISRSGRDILAMLMRDIRLAGFKYHLGDNDKGVSPSDDLTHNAGVDDILKSHDPIIIIQNKLGYTPVDRIVPDDETNVYKQHNTEHDLCCDRIHIVYGDFAWDGEELDGDDQAYKRYKVTYYAMPSSRKEDKYYSVYKTKESWIETENNPDGAWTSKCSLCYHEQLVREHLVDMEFIAYGKNGKIFDPPPIPNAFNSVDLYNIRVVDVKLTFRSKDKFYKYKPKKDKVILAISGNNERMGAFDDKYLRDSVVVSVHTRNIKG